MSLPRTSMFNSNLTQLLAQACDEENCTKIDSHAMVEILKQKFNLSPKTIEEQELFEQAILDFIKKNEPLLQNLLPSSISGNASWYMNVKNFERYLIIDYRSLNESQRQKIVESYNENYGINASTQEGYVRHCAERFGAFTTGSLNALHIQHGILFPKPEFFKNILDKLASHFPQQQVNLTHRKNVI